jgi:hypothetical protein
VESVEVRGVPAPLQGVFLEGFGWKPGARWGPLAPYWAARRLRRGFSCVRSVRTSRSWFGRRVRFEVELERPVAVATRSGKPAGFLGLEGRLFQAPEGAYGDSSLPEADLTGVASGADLEPLGRMVAAAAVPGALPFRLLRVRPDAEGDGWTAMAAGGLTLAWGSLDWTEEKLRRLREVLADAAPRFGAVVSADLRHFEDGKILVTPR